MTAVAGNRLTTSIAEAPSGYWKRAGATLTIAAAIAAAPGLAPRPDMAVDAPRLVLTSASRAAAQSASSLPNGVAESLLHYGADLSLWASRLLPIPGAVLYHAQVAQATIVDPMSASIVSNLNAFLEGHLQLETALGNISNDFVASIQNFVKTELAGHSGVVPPVSMPQGGVEPWVQWAIHVAISPLYYLPLPNAITIDQLSFAGVLAGTMISSLIDNLGSVVNGGASLDVAMERFLNTFGQNAFPRFIGSEQALFTPPPLPIGLEQAINGLAAQAKDWSQVHDPIDFLSQLGIHSLGAIVQEFDDPVPVLRQVIINNVSDLESLAAGADPVAMTAAKIDRARAAFRVIVHMTEIIGGALGDMPKNIGMQFSTSVQAFNAALRTGDLGRVVRAAIQGVVDVATSALAGLNTVGNEVATARSGIADALGNRLSDKRSPETDSAAIARPRAVGGVGEVPDPDAAKQGDKLGQSGKTGSTSPGVATLADVSGDEEDSKESEATTGAVDAGEVTSDGRDVDDREDGKDRPLHHRGLESGADTGAGSSTAPHVRGTDVGEATSHGRDVDDREDGKDRPLHHRRLESGADTGAGSNTGPHARGTDAGKATSHHRDGAATKRSGGESHSTGARHRKAA